MKSRYPKDWPAISARIRERDGNRCKWCEVANYQRGKWIDGLWYIAHPKGSEPSDRPRCDRVTEFPCYREDRVVWAVPIQIILTVAHLNHTPEDCSDENLAALCQRCHKPLRRTDATRRNQSPSTIARRTIRPVSTGGQTVMSDRDSKFTPEQLAKRDAAIAGAMKALSKLYNNDEPFAFVTIHTDDDDCEFNEQHWSIHSKNGNAMTGALQAMQFMFMRGIKWPDDERAPAVAEAHEVAKAAADEEQKPKQRKRFFGK